MRKSLGVAGLLALLVLPVTGSALANNDHPPDPACGVDVLVAANVAAGAKADISGDILNADADATVPVSGNVVVRICVAADPGVQVALTGAAAVKGSHGCFNVNAKANLAAGLQGGGVKATATVLAGVNPTAVATLNGSVNLAPMTTINGAVLTNLTLCIKANANVAVGV